MANQDVRVSALQSASTLSTEDLALATVVDELSETGYTSKKITEGAKASQYMEAFTFANLNTSAKTIVGAINEAATTGGSDEFIIHMTDTTVTETAADIIDAFDNGSEIWLESQITGETIKARLPLLAYISNSSQLVLRFSGITYANNKYRYCDVQMLRSPEQIVGKQSINVTFAVIDDATTSSSSVWSSQKTASELAGKAEIDDTAIDTETTWSSSRIVSLLPTESASGDVASFETPLTLPLVSHNVTIEPVQAGTGDPSPSNIRPISGWSAVNVTRSGKNLFNYNEIKQVQYTAEGSLRWGYEFAKAGTYTISCVANISGFIFAKVVSNGIYGEAYNILQGGTYTTSPTITINEGDILKVYCSANEEDSKNLFNVDKLQVELGSTSTTYEAYTGVSVEIPLGQTVYGGELDVKNGVLTINKVSLIYDGSNDESWAITSTYTISGQSVKSFGITLDEIKTATVRHTAIANEFVYHAQTINAYDQFTNIYWNIKNLEILPQGVTTVEELRTFLSNNPLQLVYQLATPVEVTLTPEQINTLEGVNNIWADTGDTSVEYKQDIQTYIDSRLSSGTRSLSLAKVPVETKEETKQEEQEGDEDVNR